MKTAVFAVLLSVLLASGVAHAGEQDQVTLVYGAPTGSMDRMTTNMWFSVYEAIHPDIKFKEAGYPRAGYEERLLTQFSTKTSDVDFFTEWGNTEEFMDREFVVPLDGSVDPGIKISDDLRKRIDPQLIKMFTYPQFPMRGRTPKLYMLPVNGAHAMLLIYREDLIKEAGFDGPPKTWDDRIKYGQKLTRDINGDGVIDIYGDAFNGSRQIQVGRDLIQTFVNALFTAGGEYLDAKGMPAFNSPTGVKALQYLSDLKNKYKTVPPGVMTYNFTNIRDLFASGKLAMGENWSAHWNWLDHDPGSQVRGKVMITGIPYLTKPGGYSQGGSLGIPVTSKHRKEAWEFFKFMMLDSTQTLVHLSFVNIASVPSVVKSADIRTSLSPRDLRASEIYDGIAQRGTPLPLFRGSSKVIRVLGDQIERVLNLQVTPKEGLDTAANEARKIIEAEK